MNPNAQIPMQPMPVQYTICKANSPTALEDAVNCKLAEGFTLHGPTFCAEHGCYVQPLVRLELKPIAFPNNDPFPIAQKGSPILG